MSLKHPQISPRVLGLKVRNETSINWLTRLKPYGVVSRVALEGAENLEKKRAVVGQVIRETPLDGVVAAVVRCCDSGEALVQKLLESGTKPSQLRLPNLTTMDILGLKPNYAEFLEKIIVFRAQNWAHEENPALAFSRHILGNVEENAANCKLPDRFVVKFVQIGMIWKKSESPGKHNIYRG